MTYPIKHRKRHHFMWRSFFPCRKGQNIFKIKKCFYSYNSSLGNFYPFLNANGEQPAFFLKYFSKIWRVAERKDIGYLSNWIWTCTQKVLGVRCSRLCRKSNQSWKGNRTIFHSRDFPEGQSHFRKCRQSVLGKEKMRVWMNRCPWFALLLCKNKKEFANMHK